ncbi:VOC family protein [Pontibacter sp. G13]|uniref:VOC family protein n=1 Tax=Pontibacter sp. G13 TaxID=3074898 RepID=UPI00288C34C6|nr:VOC family protein [Pontibacter sp. G13]WNJ20347.1 VOC family protein [Pontibacter sp. G13]
MKYAYTIFYVEDVSATLQFYVRAFGFQQKFITPEQDYGELISGETTIAFASLALGESNFHGASGFEKTDLVKKSTGMEMAFVTDTIEEDFQRAIDAGAVEYVGIATKPWGQQVGYLRDPNGILIEICTPVKK